VAAGGTQQPHLPSLPRPGRPRPDAPGNAVFQTLRCRRHRARHRPPRRKRSDRQPGATTDSTCGAWSSAPATCRHAASWRAS